MLGIYHSLQTFKWSYYQKKKKEMEHYFFGIKYGLKSLGGLFHLHIKIQDMKPFCTESVKPYNILENLQLF